MSLLDYARFGLKTEDFDNYDTIVGVDLGHGECAATRFDLPVKVDGSYQAVSVRPTDLYFDGDQGLKIISVLFIRNDGAVKIGPDAVGNKPSSGRLYTNFKVNPERLESGERCGGRTKKELMQLFFRELVETLLRWNPSLKERRIVLAVGCPSSPEWTDGGNDVRYAALLGEKLERKIPIVVIPESRASLLKVYRENPQRDRLVDGVIVFDHGSSTLDRTSINFRHSELSDDSIPLGASYIEENMLEHFFDEKHPRTNLRNETGSRLDLRRAKESYYTDPDKEVMASVWFSSDGVHREVTDALMTEVSAAQQIDFSTDTRSVVSGSWESICRQFYVETREAWHRKYGETFHGMILLTGGASRMGFIARIAAEVFPEATIVCDREPSFCVSRGLAYALSTDIEALRLIRSIKEKIAERVQNGVCEVQDRLKPQLTKAAYDYIHARMKEWVVNGDRISLSQMVRQTSESFRSDRGVASTIDGIVTRQIDLFVNGTDGLRRIIVESVNGVLAERYPRLVNDKVIPPFQLSDEQWEKVRTLFAGEIAFYPSSVIDNLAIDDLLTGLFKFLLGIVWGALIVVSGFVDGIWKLFTGHDPELSEKISDLYTPNKDRLLNRSGRQKFLESFEEKRDEILLQIAASIESNCLTSDQRRKIAELVNANIEPEVEAAVDVVALHFS